MTVPRGARNTGDGFQTEIELLMCASSNVT